MSLDADVAARTPPPAVEESYAGPADALAGLGGSGALLTRNVSVRQSLGLSVARGGSEDSPTSGKARARGVVFAENRGDVAFGLSRRRVRLTLPAFSVLQAQWDPTQGTQNGFGGGGGFAFAADTARSNSLFATNANALFRSFAFEGDERSRAAPALASQGGRATGTSRTHLFVLGNAWRPSPRWSITPQLQAFLLYRGAGSSFAGARRERAVREGSLEAAHLWSPRDRSALTFRYQHHALRGTFGSQRFDVAFVEASGSHGLSPTSVLSAGAQLLAHEKGASPLSGRYGGRLAMETRGKAWKAGLEGAHANDAAIPGIRTRVAGSFEARFAPRWSHFESAGFDRIAVARTEALGPGAVVREARAEAGVRNDLRADILWGSKIELVRTDPGREARDRRVSLVGFLQWTPWKDDR